MSTTDLLFDGSKYSAEAAQRRRRLLRQRDSGVSSHVVAVAVPTPPAATEDTPSTGGGSRPPPLLTRVSTEPTPFRMFGRLHQQQLPTSVPALEQPSAALVTSSTFPSTIPASPWLGFSSDWTLPRVPDDATAASHDHTSASSTPSSSPQRDDHDEETVSMFARHVWYSDSDDHHDFFFGRRPSTSDAKDDSGTTQPPPAPDLSCAASPCAGADALSRGQAAAASWPTVVSFGRDPPNVAYAIVNSLLLE